MDRPPTRRGSALGPQVPSSAMQRENSAYPAERPPSRKPPVIPTWSDEGRPPSRAADFNEGRSLRTARPTTSNFDPSTLNNRIGTGRMTTARPKSRASFGQNGPATIATQMSAAAMERPITQQELGDLKTAYKGPHRQVQDKSYFQGLLRSKIAELNSEIQRLSRDIASYDKDRASLPTLDKKVKEVAKELADYQGKVGDLNVLIERMVIDTEVDAIENELRIIKADNDRETRDVEIQFSEGRTRQDTTQALERELEQEFQMADALVANMESSKQERYYNLRQTSANLLNQIETLTSELAQLAQRAKVVEDDIGQYQTKQQLVKLKQRLEELEEQKAEIARSEMLKETPEQERERLLNSVKTDNAEIVMIDQQLKEMQTSIDRLQTELLQVERLLDENKSEKTQKYRDLRKREQTMDEFLNGFEANAQTERERLTALEQQIVTTLERLSRSHFSLGHTPNFSEFSMVKDDLQFKEEELQKSRSTVEGLLLEHQRLQTNLSKLESLESKIRGELQDLRDRTETMEHEMESFKDTEGIRRKAEERRLSLSIEHDALLQKQTQLKKVVQELQEKYNEYKAQLDANDTHVQLVQLERKLALLEESNVQITDFIEAKKRETDTRGVKFHVMEQTRTINDILQRAIKRES